LAALRSQTAIGHEPLENSRRARIAANLAHEIAIGRELDVEPPEVVNLQGAHDGKAKADRAADSGVDLLRRGHPLLEQVPYLALDCTVHAVYEEAGQFPPHVDRQLANSSE